MTKTIPSGDHVALIMQRQRAAKAAQSSPKPAALAPSAAKPSAAAPSAAAQAAAKTHREVVAEVERLKAENFALKAKLHATKPAASTPAKPPSKPAKPDPVAEYLAAVESGDTAKRQALFAKHKHEIRNHYRKITPGA